MDALIIAGLSKLSGAQFSLKKDYRLTKEGVLMNYSNLLKEFNVPGQGELADYDTPYLSGIYLYNYLKKRKVSCGLINFLDTEEDRFKAYLQQDPKVIAISTTFLVSIRAVKNVTKIVRTHAPDATIVLGGPLVYNSYLLYKLQGTGYETDPCKKDYFFLGDDKFYYEDIDLFVVEEQGEETLWHIIQRIKDAGDYRDLPNLAYYENDRLTITHRVPENNDFSEDLINWEEIKEHLIYPIMPLRGSRGCPYKCKYCNFCIGRAFRLKSADILSQEISSLVGTGKIKMIRFTDDNLFISGKHIEVYCRKIIEAGNGIQWTSFIRANAITEENVNLIKQSGCVLAQIGIESGDRKILQEMDKKSTPEEYLKVIELLNSHGISTQLYFIIGFPGETPQSINNTIDFINNLHHAGPAINELMVFPFVFAPLSPVYEPENRGKYHITGYMAEWSHSSMNSEQAIQYTKEFILKVNNIYPHYGIEEFLMADSETLKKISALRTQIKKAELLRQSPEEIGKFWQQLQSVLRR